MEDDLIGYLYPDGSLVLEEDFNENTMGDDYIVIFYSTTLGELMDYALHSDITQIIGYMIGE